MSTQAYLAIASVQVSRTTTTPVGVSTSHSMTQHWRFGIDDADRMRGIAFEEALKAKPGYAVDQILVQIVDLAPRPASPAEDHENPSHVGRE